MDFRIRQLKRALEPLREALESHHRSLEGLESALIEFEETSLTSQNRGRSVPRPNQEQEALTSSRSRTSVRSWGWANLGSTGVYRVGRYLQ